MSVVIDGAPNGVVLRGLREALLEGCHGDLVVSELDGLRVVVGGFTEMQH